MKNNTIRIALVDDHQIILDSLSLLFNMIEGVEVIATFNDPRQVVEGLKKEQPDILITDFSMPYMNGVQLTLQVKDAYPELKVIMLTVADQGDAVQDAYRAGVSGYVMKKADRKELELAVKMVAGGQMYFNQEVMKSLLTQPSTHHQDLHAEEKLSQLTKRELEIIQLIAQEMSSVEIAEKLFISVGTVETHRHNIMRKLDVKNVIGVIKFAIKYGLV
ncbi:MAG: response regulator transcription factor [Saprospiraceae bacterium]|nr:response regulator transcription factor [Saprospiraceae bacterium]MCB9320252.1 response regulator transcription factor [Lewinellaceae bacterium]